MSNAKSSLKIAIAGLGVVGAEVARQVINRSDELGVASGKLIQVVAVSARDRSVDRGVSLDGIDWYDEAPKLAERDDIDIIVEMIGGSEGVALDLARAALESGKHLITANKAMIAHHGAELSSTSGNQ